MPLHRRDHQGPFIFQWPNTFCILSNATQTNLFLFVQCVWRSMSCFCSRDHSYQQSNSQLTIELFITFTDLCNLAFQTTTESMEIWVFTFFKFATIHFFINSNAPQIIFSYLFSASGKRRPYFFVGIILINESIFISELCDLLNLFRFEQTGFLLRVTHT